jgi:hypothetical protein
MHFYVILALFAYLGRGLASRMAPRWPLEAHFELFWALVAAWLPGSF